MRYISAEQVGAINARTKQGEGLTAANRAGVEGAVGRMRSGFAGVEAFPTIWDKGGALLHGLASTQHFVDGNKRTAWLSTLLFLESNGYRMPLVSTIEAEAAVLAIATVHDFAEDKAAEWLRSVHGRSRPGYTQSNRLEYLFLAGHVEPGDSTLTVLDGHLATIGPPELPVTTHVYMVSRVHRAPRDLGGSTNFRVEVEPAADPALAALDPDSWAMDIPPAVVGGHEHQPHQIMPTIIWMGLTMVLHHEGTAWLQVFLDGEPAGRVPVRVALVPEAPESLGVLGF